MSDALRIGILGGTFDPIHLGHIELAKAAIDKLNLDKVLLMPAAIPNFKRGKVHADIKDRLAMCEIAVKDEPEIGVSDIEALRKGTTYTVDTISELTDMLDKSTQLVFLLGSDSAATLLGWRGAKDLAKMIAFKVFARDCSHCNLDIDALRDFGFDIEQIDVGVKKVSSTEIREAIAQRKDTSDLLNNDVYAYIKENDLYKK